MSLIRGRTEHRKETWKVLYNYGIRGYSPHDGLFSLLTLTASSEDSKSPLTFHNSLERLTELTENLQSQLWFITGKGFKLRSGKRKSTLDRVQGSTKYGASDILACGVMNILLSQYSCDNTHRTLPTRKLIGDVVFRVLLGLYSRSMID